MAKYTTVKHPARTGRCDGCKATRNRLALYRLSRFEGEPVHAFCTACLGHDYARLTRNEVARAGLEADLRAALDHGSNDDIARCAFALGHRVRLGSGEKFEVYA